MSINGNFLRAIARDKVLNELYPQTNTNALQVKKREYLVEKNNDDILRLTEYIASRYWPIYKGNSNMSFSELLKKAFLELGIDKKSMLSINQEEFERWSADRAIEKSRKGKR